MTDNPYRHLPPEAFWRTGVAEERNVVAANFYRRKWPISRDMKIATAGSCFAQHIGRHLKGSGFAIMDVEPPPRRLPAERRMDFGYGIYSARYGNIYTARQLLQLGREAFGIDPMVDEVWALKDGWVDAMRPTIEPEPHETPEAVRIHRRHHIDRVREMLLDLDVLIFTLGLTEAWEDTQTGRIYALCPGTVAGEFNPARHRFKNFTYDEVYGDLKAFHTLLLEARGGRPFRMLLTVSPVPLTATASGRHVQVATVHSKSILRAVAGQFEAEHPEVDYFPSYEIVTSPWSGVMSYEPNLRSVRGDTVARVMGVFSQAHGGGETPVQERRVVEPSAESSDKAMDVACDEELLEAFGAR